MNEYPSPETTRREGVASHPLRLADGNDWGFARPTFRLMPAVEHGLDRLGRPTETIAVRPTFGYRLEIQRHVDALDSAREDGTPEQQFRAFFALSASLLRRAHEIDLGSACALLNVGEAELPRLVAEVVAVVAGARVEPVGGSQRRGQDGTDA